ncbi:MAG: hypothetical protein Q9O24_13660 [Gammaproteobacteria bacterium]|nr:hypothetical protein [Gammaproteobacteria bacterium]
MTLERKKAISALCIWQSPYLRLSLLSVVLLVSQFTLLDHSVKHAFHTPSETCALFIQAEQPNSGTFNLCSPAPQHLAAIQAPAKIITLWSSPLHPTFLARAPPVFL